MIALPQTPVRRIALALLVSLAVHAAILWLPDIELTHNRVALPPLTVRIEHLPNPSDKPAEKPEPAQAMTKLKGSPSSKPASAKLTRMSASQESSTPQPFPSHLQLTFIVHDVIGGSMTGKVRQRLDIHGDRYTLQSMRQAAGPARLRNSSKLIQTSSGRIVDNGLQPDLYEETQISRAGTRKQQVDFDWDAHALHYPDDQDVPLPEGAQDRLSFMYQLSRMPAGMEYYPLAVTGTEQLDPYQIEIGARETLETPLGKLNTLHLRKMHGNGEAWFDIWLGLDYRMLPVRLIEYDSTGEVTSEFVVTDMRAAED